MRKLFVGLVVGTLPIVFASCNGSNSNSGGGWQSGQTAAVLNAASGSASQVNTAKSSDDSKYSWNLQAVPFVAKPKMVPSPRLKQYQVLQFTLNEVDCGMCFHGLNHQVPWLKLRCVLK